MNEVILSDNIDLNDFDKATPETTGHFTNELYDSLPGILQDGTNVLSGNDKEVFLVGSLTALSSVLPNFQTTYDGQAVESNLYTFLYGNYGSGKGALRYARNLVSPVHKYLRETETIPEGSDQQPQKLLLFIPANSSKSGVIELLERTKGKGLIFETEADTLTDILRQDYGNFSDILRSAYHHETISLYRRLNKEYVDMDKPKLSVLLSGTPKQLRKLIPTIENGLFSRFSYFGLESELSFKNVFDTSKGDLNKHFYDIGERLLELYKYLDSLSEPLVFELQGHQKAEFLSYFQELKRSLIETYGDTMAGSVNRFGMQFIRVAMILTALRNFETGEFNTLNYCNDLDFDNAKQIIEVFTWHTLNIYDSMAAKSLEDLPDNKQAFYKALSFEFTTSQAVNVGEEYELSKSTVNRFIDNLQLFENVKHGHYRKTK